MLAGVEKADFDAFKTQWKSYESAEEARLAYVAFTRPRHELWVSSYVWGQTTRIHGPSEYQRTLRGLLEDEVATGVRHRAAAGVAGDAGAEDRQPLHVGVAGGGLAAQRPHRGDGAASRGRRPGPSGPRGGPGRHGGRARS